MEIDAFLFMLFSWGLILGILTFCLIKLLRNPESAPPLSSNNKKNGVSD